MVGSVIKTIAKPLAKGGITAIKGVGKGLGVVGALGLATIGLSSSNSPKKQDTKPENKQITPIKKEPRRKSAEEKINNRKSKIQDMSAESALAGKNAVAAIKMGSMIREEKELDNDSQEGKKSKFSHIEQQEQNRQKAFDKAVMDAMKRIASSQDTIAAEVVSANKKKQVDDDFGERKQSFVGKSIDKISAVVKKDESGSMLAMIIMGLIAALGSLIDWWREASEYTPGGILGYIWNGINSFIQTNFGGWGKFVWDVLKDQVNFVLWLSDKVMEVAFGKDWDNAKIFWGEQFQKISDWWQETVDYGGIPGWLYKQLYDYLDNDNYLKKIMSNPEDMKEKLRIQAEESTPMTEEQEALSHKRRDDMIAARAKGIDPDTKEWMENWNKINNITHSSTTSTTSTPIKSITSVSTSTPTTNSAVSNTTEIRRPDINNTVVDSSNVSNVSGVVVSITKTDNEGNSTITVRTNEGNTVDINNVKNSSVEVGSVVKVGQKISISNASEDNTNTANIENKTMSVNDSISNAETNNVSESNIVATNSNISSSQIDLTNSTDVAYKYKNINIESSEEPKANVEQHSSALQAGINKELAAQIGKLSAVSNNGTLLQTRVSVV